MHTMLPMMLIVQLGDASNKIQAGAKAVANKIKDPNKDTGTDEYDKEKVKEELD